MAQSCMHMNIVFSKLPAMKRSITVNFTKLFYQSSTNLEIRKHLMSLQTIIIKSDDYLFRYALSRSENARQLLLRQ